MDQPSANFTNCNALRNAMERILDSYHVEPPSQYREQFFRNLNLVEPLQENLPTSPFNRPTNRHRQLHSQQAYLIEQCRIYETFFKDKNKEYIIRDIVKFIAIQFARAFLHPLQEYKCVENNCEDFANDLMMAARDLHELYIIELETQFAGEPRHHNI